MFGDKPLFWHQGLFLQPQHFQQFDLHSHYRLRPLRRYLQPYFWGVGRIDIRQGALETRMFEVSRAELIFNDGYSVDFPDNAQLTPRSFEEAWVSSDEPFTVYIGLKKLDQKGGNVTVADDEAVGSPATTFVVSPNPVITPDLLGDGPSGGVRQMRYVLRVFWENEIDQLGDYTLLPVAQLIRDGETISLSPDFAPPCITMAGSETLTAILKDIRDQLVSRCRRLEEYKSPGALTGDELDYASTVFLLALRSVNRFAPVLQQLTEVDHIHPWQVYGFLRQLIGELSSFAHDVSATGEGPHGRRLLPKYDHLDLAGCFKAAQRLITRILNSLTAGPEYTGRFIFEDPYYTVELPESAVAPDNTYWLLITTGREAEEVCQDFETMAKLSATGGMSSLLARAVHGITVTRREETPPGVPRRKGAIYYLIDSASPQWAEVETSGSLSLYWDGAPDDAMIYLAALKR